MSAKPRVAIIATGGTISGLGNGSLDFFNYGSAGRFMKGDELVGRIAELSVYADIQTVPYDNIPSTEIAPRHWIDLIKIIHDLKGKDPDLAGCVITHGTASLEETAYFLNLTLKVDCSVVLVGAQRPPSALGTDAALNVLNAVRVAASPRASGLGVLVVVNGEINAAREVSKTSTYRSQTFQSQDLGLLGYADGDEIVIYRHPVRRHYPATEFDVTGLADMPRVDIVPTYAGSDGIFVDAAVAAGCKGIIAAGMAPGVVTRAQLACYEKAQAKGIIVVQSSRAATGRISGARQAILDAGMIPADTLSPQKARLLLMLALTRSTDRGEITRMFAEY